MAREMTQEGHARLVELKDEIKERMDEVKALVRAVGGIEWERAKSYWIAHVYCALDKDHEWMGGSMFTMEDTINALDPGEPDEEEEDATDA